MITDLTTSDYNYDLPTELIAQAPLLDRSAARMMVLTRATSDFQHVTVRDLPSFLRVGDLIVTNDTRVIPARVFGHKEGSGGKVELLFLEEVGPNIWEALCGSSRRPKIGTRIILMGGRGVATVQELGNTGKLTLSIESDAPMLEILYEHGIPPLPPYIKRKENKTPAAMQQDREYYQTIYARAPGAVAAPTAGLHFDEHLLQRLKEAGVGHVSITLHVGMGTFKPVSVERIEHHVMEAERYEIQDSTASVINETRRMGGRILAVGSTVVRTLESVADSDGRISPGSGRTGIFIHPPHRIRSVDMMLTNFHLPRSTLLMMISALAGRDLVLRAYREAIRLGYRFCSYGDCMLIR